MTTLKLSKAKSLAPAFELIELPVARDSDGNRLVVRCDALKPRDAVHITKALPGKTVQLGLKDEQDDTAQMDRLLVIWQELIERGTALAGPSGSLVRPAFWFDAGKPHDPLSLDGNDLTLFDIGAMGNSILRLSGFSEEAASTSFPRRKRA